MECNANGHVSTLDANRRCSGMFVSSVLNDKILTLARIGDRMGQYHRYWKYWRYFAADAEKIISIKIKNQLSSSPALCPLP